MNKTVLSLVLFIFGCGASQEQEAAGEFYPPTPDVSFVAFNMSAPTASSYGGLVNEGDYDEISESVRLRLPDCPEAGQACNQSCDPLPSELVLAYFAGSYAGTAEVVEEELAKYGLRSANACELLMFGVQYPDVQRTVNVWAHGTSVRNIQDSEDYFLRLSGDSDRRVLSWSFPNWGDKSWFLAARMN